jgi:hypothetical protein
MLEKYLDNLFILLLKMLFSMQLCHRNSFNFSHITIWKCSLLKVINTSNYPPTSFLATNNYVGFPCRLPIQWFKIIWEYGKWVFKTFFVLKYCNKIILIWLVFFNVKNSTMLYMRVVSIYLHNVNPKILAPFCHYFIELNFKVYEKISWTYSNLDA